MWQRCRKQVSRRDRKNTFPMIDTILEVGLILCGKELSIAYDLYRNGWTPEEIRGHFQELKEQELRRKKEDSLKRAKERYNRK